MRILTPLRLLIAATAASLVLGFTAPLEASSSAHRAAWPPPAWSPLPSAPPAHAHPALARHGRPALPRRVWVPGGWVEQQHRHWVAGHTSRVWQEPRFSWRFDSCGRRVKVELSSGAWRTVRHPGRWEVTTTRVWRPGHWAWADC